MATSHKAIASRRPRIKAAFLKFLGTGLTIEGSARAAGTTGKTAHEWRKEDAVFAAAWEEALKDGNAAVEDEMRRRGVEGVRKMVLHGGKPVLVPEGGEYDLDGKPLGKLVPLYEHRYSDTMLAMMANGRMPEKYRRNVVEVTGKDGGPIKTEANINDLELARRIAFILSRKKPPDADAPADGAPPPATGQVIDATADTADFKKLH